MQLSTTFRHMDASQAVRDYAEEKLDKIRKYFQKDPIAAHAVFAVERGFHHVADINITLPNGIVINAKETTEDMYSSIDLATARIERQVRKWKDKIRDHKPHGGPSVSVREMVILAEELEPRHASPGGGPADTAPTAVRSQGGASGDADDARVPRREGRDLHRAVDESRRRGDAAQSPG